MPVVAEVVAVEEVRRLRQRVLRPGWPEGASAYPRDDDPLAVHVAVRPRPGAPLEAVGSLLPEEPPEWLRTWPGVPALGSAEAGAAEAGAAEAGAAEAGAADGGAGRGGSAGPVPGPRWWRIRGMATAEGLRGRGRGQAVLELLLERAGEGGGAVWCTARLPALSLYRRAGFAAAGEVFDLPGIGPHLTMWLALPPR